MHLISKLTIVISIFQSAVVPNNFSSWVLRKDVPNVACLLEPKKILQFIRKYHHAGQMDESPKLWNDAAFVASDTIAG